MNNPSNCRPFNKKHDKLLDFYNAEYSWQRLVRAAQLEALNYVRSLRRLLRAIEHLELAPGQGPALVLQGIAEVERLARAAFVESDMKLQHVGKVLGAATNMHNELFLVLHGDKKEE